MGFGFIALTYCCSRGLPIVAAEEIGALRVELQEVKRLRSELQTSLDVAGGELKKYQLKIANLEGAVSAKERELQEQAGLLREKEATVQRLSEGKFDADLYAKQMGKRHRELEAATGCKSCYFCLVMLSSLFPFDVCLLTLCFCHNATSGCSPWGPHGVAPVGHRSCREDACHPWHGPWDVVERR